MILYVYVDREIVDRTGDKPTERPDDGTTQRPDDGTTERPSDSSNNLKPDMDTDSTPGTDTDSEEDDRREGDKFERTIEEDDFVEFVERLLAKFDVYRDFNSVFTRSKLFTE